MFLKKSFLLLATVLLAELGPLNSVGGPVITAARDAQFDSISRVISTEYDSLLDIDFGNAVVLDRGQAAADPDLGSFIDPRG